MKAKVTVRSGKPSGSGTVIARVPVKVAQSDSPKGKMIYQTKAQLNVHIERGKRKTGGKPRGAAQ